VTVAALGLGVLSVAPSSAAVQLDSISVSAASTTQVAGETLTANSVVVTATLASINTETMTVTATIKSGPAYIAPKFVFIESTTAATTGTTTSEIKISGRTSSVTQATAKYSLYLDAPTVAGTYVVALTPSGHVNAVARDVTIVVSAKTVGKTSVFIGTGGVNGTDTATADATISVASTASTTHRARIDVGSIYGTTGNETASAADAPAVVVTIDKGLVSKTNDFSGGAKSVSTAAGVDADPSYWVFSNGDVGKATISITVGSNAAVTKNVTFTGPATALAAAKGTGANDATWVAVGSSNSTVVVTSTDSAGTAVNNPSGLTVTSSDTSVATVSTVVATNATTGTITVTGVKAGTAVLTVKDPATTGAATSATYTVTVKAVRPTTAPTITFDKTSYAVGELVTMTVGADMADSATAQLFTSTGLVMSATVVASGTAVPTNGQHAIVGGVATYKFYAPAVSGSLTVTGTTGGAVDITTAATVTKTVDILNPGVDAATAAAELAEAAAQDATDAALDATEAATLAGALAQEAVDAVADLSTQVAKLIAELKKQITTLTNLVIKIQKKVKA